MDNTTSLKVTNRNAIVIVFIIGAFVTILNQTLLVTALPHIMRSFNITADKVQWLTTAFMLVNGIFIPVTAFLIEKYSTRTLFMSFMGIFVIGTLVAALAPNFSVLLIARILQAVGAGGIMPLMQTVFLVIFPKEKRGTAMGMMGLVIAFAPAIGPTLSGWIVDRFSWHYLFYIILPIAIIDVIIAIFILKNVTEQRKIKLDILSVILSSLGFGGILYGFSTAGSNGWSDKWVIAAILVGLISMLLFVLRQLKQERPLLELRVFKNRTFTITTILGMISFASMMGLETILPMYTQNLRNITAFHSGLMLLPGAIVMGAMSPITGVIFDKIGAKLIGIIGFLILTVTTFFFAFLDLNTSLTFIIIVYAIRMAGISMVMMPLITAGINALPSNLIAHATAVNNTFRQVAASIGTAVLITVMTNAAKNSASKNPLNAMVTGMDAAFLGAAILACAGLVLIFALKQENKNKEAKEVVEEIKVG
ncbi:drug resistance transporter, EmrB/QacA subfamily [Clostridium pasteurianum DSM 525 = ATCC 6013]|uniref:Drug resistance transporter, EmrB/QacA subfamily n=1 Tax=Clostridium pasteurianum DSM 525 = ATCC 6013 TaxID=1262449 RepID=A0A0H3J310_CLOPA|nr:MDR family MFS transporter [Clostridium pasteurianum]AJA47182.1 drug resistance transporter, EmrB/QacA subfamily [Clostridium pasteurianum DSM 525 = ATCC 6013]AJA51170.1 drug resistance transporter, EmrB/QacA subfamily [Clostridium pasteurianum DSM 525 = ATCC 6013]AOZ74537.1 multidrug MFS transporter [Clostridium pasteurianum DSM 525 = ATCC 6013]AOZ78334.1 multidrug MFS transporter [Clostridium pasteurianum]ELP59433.1 major facilitator superfamily protein YcnB [Clostridium pasteurianum DSM 